MASHQVSLSGAISKLRSALAPDRKDIGAIYSFAILTGLVQLSLPLGIQSIINYVMAGRFSTSIAVLIVGVVFGVFINGLLVIRQMQIIEKVRQKIFTRYSMEYSDRIPRLNIEKLDSQYLPETVNRYFDIVTLQKVLDKILLDIPAALITVIFGLSLLSLYHPIFIVFGLVLIAFLLGILRLTSPLGLKSALKASHYKYGVAGWLQEVARTVKTFKYTRGTKMHLHTTDSLVSKYLDERTSHFKVLLTQYWSLVSFKILITAAMLIIGSYLLVNQMINVGQFIASDIVILSIMGSVEKLITTLDSLYDALVSTEKLSTVTDAETENSGSLILPDSSAGVSVSFKNVNFAYGDNAPTLTDISADIPAGYVAMLQGPSGSGKSTMLRLLTGAFVNYTGSVTIDGVPVANYNIESLRGHTGILLGSQDIFQGSIWDNITLGNNDVDLKKVRALAEACGLMHFVNDCQQGFDTVIQPLGHKLSINVRKNILLIRALLGNNRLLLLEQPFDHLEEPYKSNMIEFLKKHSQATCIIASYDESLAKHCNMVIRINKEGRLVA